jgi:PAS domain-containing protein
MVFLLYVAGRAPHSADAIANLRRLCARYLRRPASSATSVTNRSSSARSVSRRPTMPEPDDEIARLVRSLAEAEAALADALTSGLDAVVLPEGHVFLLRAAQQALIESEARATERAALLEGVLASAPDAILNVDAEGKVLFANRVACDTRAESLVGTWWLEDVDADHRDALAQAFQSVIETGRSRVIEGPGPAEPATVPLPGFRATSRRSRGTAAWPGRS